MAFSWIAKLSTASRSVLAGASGGLAASTAQAAGAAVKKRVESLQSLRLFASLGVFQYHLWNNYLQVHINHPGTDFFLVLVGAVAAFSQARCIPEGNWGRYILSRVVRLYVTYIPLFLITVGVKWDEMTWDWAWRSFLLIPTPGRLPVIGATWMLAFFMLFYLLFSLAILARREWTLVLVFGAWAGAVAAHTWWGWRPGLPEHWANVLLAERNLDMLWGYLVGLALRQNWVRLSAGRALFWVGAAGMIGGTYLLNMVPTEVNRSLFLGIPVALFVLGTGALERLHARDAIVHLLTRPWLVWLGGTSYVLYLSHPLFLQAWSRLLPMTPALVPLITLGGVAAAAAITLGWEQPMLSRLRAWLRLDRG